MGALFALFLKGGLPMRNMCRECANRDMAVEMPDGLALIDNLGTAKALLRHIALCLSYPQMLERVGHSAFAAELLDYLPHIYGTTVTDLRPIATALYAKRECFEPEQLTAFADRYWPAAQQRWIDEEEYANAWTIIKLAVLGNDCLHKGSVDSVLPALVGPEPVGLLVSTNCGRRMVQELHHTMTSRGIIPNTLEEPKSVLWNNNLWPAGIGVARAIGAYNPNSVKNSLHVPGQQALAVGRYAATKTTMLVAA